MPARHSVEPCWIAQAYLLVPCSFPGGNRSIKCYLGETGLQHDQTWGSSDKIFPVQSWVAHAITRLPPLWQNWEFSGVFPVNPWSLSFVVTTVSRLDCPSISPIIKLSFSFGSLSNVLACQCFLCTVAFLSPVILLVVGFDIILVIHRSYA